MNESLPWKILLIDEDVDMAEAMTIVLNDAGYMTLIAHDGETGFSVCRETLPQVVITEYNVPGMDGLQVLEAIKAFDPAIEVIFITGSGDIQVAMKALRMGASDFINKPVSDEALIIAVNRAQDRFISKLAVRRFGAYPFPVKGEEVRNGAKPLHVDLIDDSMDGAIACDESNLIVAYNRKMEGILGYAPDEVVGNLRFEHFFLPREWNRFLRDIAESRYGGRERLSSYETSLIARNGDAVLVQMSATRFALKGAKNGLICFFKDLRERKISCDQWIKLLDELSVGAFTIDLNRCIMSFNQSAQALTGLKVSEVIGKDCREIFSDIPCTDKCPIHINTKDQAESLKMEITDRNDVRHPVTRLSTPIYGVDNHVVGCLTAIQEHAALAELINRVKYEERSLKMILDNLDIGIFTVNRGGHITFFNRAAEIVSGYDRKQVLGRPSGILFDRDAPLDPELLKESITLGEPRTNTSSRLITQEGDQVPIRADYIPLHDDQNRIVGGLATMQDLTLVQQFDQMMSGRYSFHNMIGRDPAMQKIFRTVEVAAISDATILINGETGTGKDLLAKIIHSTSNRSDKAFIKVNCAALPDNLLESELFGYKKGAFTGADRDKPGRFQEADQGTIFLDEIGDFPLNLQAKLLRVLEDKEFYPLGSRRMNKVDVRIISATNRDLNTLIKNRRFREDLYYRLNVIQIRLPLLRDRPSDIPLLIRHILRSLCSTSETRTCEISKEALKILLNYSYPGNVRELHNILEHAVIVCRENLIRPEHLPAFMQNIIADVDDNGPDSLGQRDMGGADEKEIITEALRTNAWHRTRTARFLGVDRTTLWRKMKQYRIVRLG